MEIQTFRAATMHEALDLVRYHLGPDAAILHTRELRVRRLFGLFGAQRQIEVTAAAGVNVPSRFAPAAQSPAPSGDSAGPAWQSFPPGAASHSATARPLPAAGGEPHAGCAPCPEAFFPQQVQDQLADLHTMVKQLCRSAPHHVAPDLPEGLFRLFTDLLELEFSEEVARELVETVRCETAGSAEADPVLLKAQVARLLEQQIRTSGPVALTAGRCRVVALVGPTGVGKTTTIAKLAANYRLREKRRVGLITVDTYRIAAVEQLRTYADIIDLPMEVVSAPREMRRAVRDMSALDLVLIDTAGRSPRDEIKLQELRVFLQEAQADEVHLVLSSVASERALMQTAERFAAVGTTALILTKLDEASALGHILPLLRQSGLRLSYLTNGQNVPDDIEVANSARLAKMILEARNLET